MPVTTVKIDEGRKARLRSIAHKKGQSVDTLLDELVRDYLRQQEKEKKEIRTIMKLSQKSFSEWDNEEDAIYDRLLRAIFIRKKRLVIIS